MERFVCRSLASAALLAIIAPAAVSAAPTDGWTQYGAGYQVHKPYNLSLSSRFKVTSGVVYTWVYRTDAPFQSGSNTGPRSEQRWLNDYTSGNRMFDADIYVVSGTNGASIAQIFGATGRSTATMVQGTGNAFKLYGSTTIATGVNNTWVNLKMAHDANANNIRFYVRNSLVRTEADHGNGTHYFKNGVYAQGGASTRMECRFRNVRLWRR